MLISSPTTRIIGLGSPHGDDQAGWLAVDRLVQVDAIDAQPIALNRTADLLDHLAGCQHLILIDACQTGTAPGTVYQLAWPDPRFDPRAGRSTHGLSLVEMLRLATALGKCPPRVVLFAIEIEACRPATDPCAPVRRAVAQLVKQVVAEVNRSAVSTGPPGVANGRRSVSVPNGT